MRTACALAALLLSTAATADVRAQYGVRAGIGQLWGKVSGSASKSINDLQTAETGFGAQIGALIDEKYFVGLFALAGPGLGIQNCPAGHECLTSHVQLGLSAEYHFVNPNEDPSADWLRTWWIGAGTAFEVWNVHEDAVLGKIALDGSAYGAQILHLEAGLDFHVGENGNGRVGPFLWVGAGEFLHTTASLQGYSADEDIRGTELHFSALIGVRAYLLH